MPNSFNFSASPFDCLTSSEQRRLRDSLDVAYYPEGAVLLELGAEPSHLWVIIKGYVTQFDRNEVVATYGPDDSFDGRALVTGKSSHRFIATEEVVAYQLAKHTVTELIAENPTFGALLFSDLSQKLSALSQRQNQQELQSLTLSRVDEAFIRSTPVVDATDSVLAVVQVMHSQKVRAVLVRDHQASTNRTGVFTSTSLQRAILDGRALSELPVNGFTQYKLATVRPSDQLGDALVSLLSKRVHRLVVAEGEQLLGVLEALDLFSFLSNHSHLIAVKIDAARSVEELALAAQQINRMVISLNRSGTKVSLIARLVKDLNARLFDRAWHLIAPADLIQNSCLFVMGSEGRGEQLLKTDQDNGLILRDGYSPPAELAAICEQFSAALQLFGYPQCPGGIMLVNSAWRKTEHDFSQEVQLWLLDPTPDHLMNLAIFLDAQTICGDESLLKGVQQALMSIATDNDIMLARFASVIDAFTSSQGWWNRLLGLNDGSAGLHLKKEGIFPLVHGVRSLALAEHITETSTSGRIAALVAIGQIDSEMGNELIQSLHFLMGLKLKTGLIELETHQQPSGTLNQARLSSLERDLLKDALAVIKSFKSMLRHRFRLDSL